MGKAGHTVRKALYRSLSLDNYLKLLSSVFLFYYRHGMMRRSEAYEYPYFLRNLVSPGDTVIDIGANLGYYSYALSRLAGPSGKVYAVEPVRPILRVLKRNLRRCSNVEILNYALGDTERTIRMGNATVGKDGYFGTGQNFVMDKPAAGMPVVEFEAEMKRGSLLFGALEKIDFIKCDIEGYERVVMTEMTPLLEKHRPTVLIETGGDNRPFIVTLVRSLGYDGYTLHEGRMKPLADTDGKDIIFIHPSRRERFENLTEPCE